MSCANHTLEHWRKRSGAVLLILLAAAFGGLAARVAYINSTLRPELLRIAERQQSGRATLPAVRGMVLDRRERVVAASHPIPDVFVDPSLVDDVDAFVNNLAPRLNQPPGELRERLRQRMNSRYVVVAQRVDEVTAEAVAEMRHAAVGLTDSSVRNYPLRDSLAQVVGLVGRDGHGQEGIELAFDTHLSGRDGRRATIRDARRRALWRAEGGLELPHDGGHVVLTIDAEIQRITEAALADTLATFDAESGVAIVMEPATGEILALANLPSFDPNLGAPADANQRRNRAVTDPLEPGSTIKAFIASGALAGGYVSPTEKLDCRQGTYRVGRRTIRDTHPHGMMTLAGIIAKSSNIGMTLIGERMGKEALWETVRGFGFGERTGIRFPGEAPGMVVELRKWSTYTSQSVSFGYEINITPLQLVSAFSALVNDGVLMRPRLVRRLLAADGQVVESFEQPEVVRRVIPSKVARYVAEELLVGVVEEGSGTAARVEGYRVLGKSGTAKLTHADRKGYEAGAYLSNFLGAAPAADPRVAVLVMVRRPQADKGYYGGKVAAPAVARILEGTLAYLQVPRDVAVALGR